MAFQIIQRFVWAIGICIAFPMAAYAQTCALPPSVLLHSCQADVKVKLRVLPDNTQPDNNHLLTVAGTYSSGDRFGIEGLVLREGTVISRRYQNWDGVLVLDENAQPHLYHAKRVTLGGAEFNLKQTVSRAGFIAKALEMSVTVLQSHLLISNGQLDLKNIEAAPRFKRRLLVTFKDGSFGVWETKHAETLYEAARQVQVELAPDMALNLDMGAYDYCISGPIDAQKDCGLLLVSQDRLTNLLEFTKR